MKRVSKEEVGVVYIVWRSRGYWPTLCKIKFFPFQEYLVIRDKESMVIRDEERMVIRDEESIVIREEH